MKILEFTTIAERTFQVPFIESDFFDWMKVNGCGGLKIENQICLYLNLKFESSLSVHGESIRSIKYKFSKDFIEEFLIINDALKYNL